MSKGIADKKADISHLSFECRQIMQKAVKIHETEGYVNAGEMYEDLKSYMEGNHKERKGRKKHMLKRKNREKKEYFISDLKRLVCTGYTRGICLILTGLAVVGTAWKGNEVKGADMREVREEIVVTEERKPVEGKSGIEGEGMEGNEVEGKRAKESEIEGDRGKNKSLVKKEEREEKGQETEIPKDEYGRKLIVRK